MFQHNTKPQGGTFCVLCALDDLIAEHETSLPEPCFSSAAPSQVWMLWLIIHLLEDKPDIVFQHDQAPQHIHGEMTAFSKGSFICSSQLRVVNFLRCSISISDYPTPHLCLDFFVWSFVKDEVYILPVPVTMKNWKNEIWTRVA